MEEDLKASQLYGEGHYLATQSKDKDFQSSRDMKSGQLDEVHHMVPCQRALRESSSVLAGNSHAHTIPKTVTAQLNHVPKSRKILRITTPAISTLAGKMVTVSKNGNPAEFYCKLVNSEATDEYLKDARDIAVLQHSVGQGVLVRYMGRWCRATLLGCKESKWRCELVDDGQVVDGVDEVDMTDLPPKVVKIPAMAVKCSLAGVTENCWDDEALSDWARLVQDRQFMLTVVDVELHTVELTEDCVSLVSRLAFLGHTQPPTAFFSQQHYEHSSQLSTIATLCSDYQDICPHSILLYFDNPLHESHVEILGQLNGHDGLVGPPGFVEEGCAVIAPWEGRLYRGEVLSIQGTILTVLYVDHGNADQVSWWDCYAVPSTFLFPPLAEVTLARVK